MRQLSNFVVIFVFVSMCFVGLHAEDDDNNIQKSIRDGGQCGDSVFWEFQDSAHTLSISGTGSMWNFTQGSAPWSSLKPLIKSVEIQTGVTTIGSSAFFGYNQMTSVHIPESILSIGTTGFYACNRLSSIAIPNSVLELGDESFSYCAGLNTIFIPASVEIIGRSVFDHCGLSSVVVDEKNDRFSSVDGVLFDKEQKNLIYYPSGNDNTTYTLPASVTSVTRHAFLDSSNLVWIGVEEGNERFSSIDGVLFDKEGKTLIQYPPGNQSNTYTVPVGVKTLEYSSFEYCRFLENVLIGNDVETIGDGAFQSCDGLTRVFFPENVATVYGTSFCECHSLTYVDVDQNNKMFSSVGGVLFDHDQSTIVYYPYGRAYDTYVIPDSVTAIGHSAFRNNKLLKNVVIPVSVKRIEPFAFYLSGLTSVIIPDSVEFIGAYSFSACYDISNVTIPDSVLRIEKNAFSYNHLRSVFYQGSVFFSADLFFPYDRVNTVCVPPDYELQRFGGVNVTSDDELCIEFRKLFNHCFKASFVNGDFIQERRKNATECENRKDGCRKYECVNESGLFAWSLCNSTDNVTKVCTDDKCIDEASDEEQLMIKIEMDRVKASELVIEELDNTIMVLTGIKADSFTIGIEFDNSGYVKNVFIYVDDQQTALLIADALKALKEVDKCKYGSLCRTKAIQLIGVQMEEISNSHRIKIRIFCLVSWLLFMIIDQS